MNHICRAAVRTTSRFNVRPAEPDLCIKYMTEKHMQTGLLFVSGRDILTCFLLLMVALLVCLSNPE